MTHDQTSGPTCARCVHFLLGAFSLAERSPTDLWKSAPAGHGVCRRYPPRHVPDLEANETMSLFPVVHADHRCGEHQSPAPVVPL